MNPGRLYPFIIGLFLTMTLTGLERAEAFWGFGGDSETGKIGLDFDRGYDINTVSTVTGRAMAPPQTGDRKNIIIEVANGNETVSLCVGPGEYWDKHGIRINRNDQIIAKGSKAQGKDGKSYLLAQKITNQTSGEQVVLRDDNGAPAWRGAARSATRMEGPSGRSGGQGGRMMRGGGGMMRH